MRIQIYTAQSPAEALALAEAGVDHVGITPGAHGLPGEVSLDVARQIVAALGSRAVRVALTIDSDPAAIVAMVQAVQPDVLHWCGLTGTFTPADVSALRAQIPGVRFMQAIAVAGREALAEALAYQSVADYLILDTQAAGIPGIGASGQTHDWSISRAIVQQSAVPVILAGGLSPENVADAIRAVRPWGVDSLTHTNRPLPSGGFCKDIGRVRQFVQAARSAL